MSLLSRIPYRMHRRLVSIESNLSVMSIIVFTSTLEIMKIFRPSSISSSSNKSFRLEIGNINNRCKATATDNGNVAEETDWRTYQALTFEYFIDEEDEISVGNTNQEYFPVKKMMWRCLRWRLCWFLRQVLSVKVIGWKIMLIVFLKWCRFEVLEDSLLEVVDETT